jgi:hypothetical protein
MEDIVKLLSNSSFERGKGNGTTAGFASRVPVYIRTVLEMGRKQNYEIRSNRRIWDSFVVPALCLHQQMVNLNSDPESSSRAL